MKKLTDAELFRMIQQDNERAFSALFDRYKASVFRHVYQRINADAETEDIVQNIFISLWRNRQTIVIEDTFRPYLMGAAKKSVFAYYTLSAREIKNNYLLRDREEPVAYPEEEFIIARELEELVQHEVQKMPFTMGQAFQLSRKEQLSVREIAEMLNISEQTVKNNITMALQRLRGKLSARQIIHVLPIILYLN
jgi:RNA polymerase sigma-70 factor (ECF subfamily)